MTIESILGSRASVNFEEKLTQQKSDLIFEVEIWDFFVGAGIEGCAICQQFATRVRQLFLKHLFWNQGASLYLFLLKCFFWLLFFSNVFDSQTKINYTPKT